MNRRVRIYFVAGVFLSSINPLFSNDVGAQLTDRTQTTPNVPGGAIAKSLEQQIGAGQGNIVTPGSSFYIIAQ